MDKHSSRLVASLLVQLYPGSTPHAAEHPSPDTTPPSSHPSDGCRNPSPHTPGGVWLHQAVGGEGGGQASGHAHVKRRKPVEELTTWSREATLPSNVASAHVASAHASTAISPPSRTKPPYTIPPSAPTIHWHHPAAATADTVPSAAAPLPLQPAMLEHVSCLPSNRVHVKPLSTVHVAEQPSPASVFPSSHASTPSLFPSPHQEEAVVDVVQRRENPDPSR
mmetsp:Transcript_5194/g.13154  ORF Transcript_5194/g.13154 Transcript_5194/m.13154 type:complete len:222 (-) Transcript_5194:501-1166(-)